MAGKNTDVLSACGYRPKLVALITNKSDLERSTTSALFSAIANLKMAITDNNMLSTIFQKRNSQKIIQQL